VRSYAHQVERKDLIRDLEVLYRRGYRQFLRVAIAIVGEESRAHDAVQEGFARAIRSADSYRAEGNVEAWLWRIVINAAHATRPDRVVVEIGEQTDRAANGHPGAENDGDIRAWVASLPERQRLAVFLRYYADLDYRTIGDVLEIETGTVSATLAAAHASLRGAIEGVRS
jgi:RNA polymerase sigma-70 factor, ECF subfamily